MELNLAGRSVIVTGGGSNIGRAISLAFAREGSGVTIAEIDEAQGKKVAAEAEKLGAASAVVVRTDVTKWESAQAMVREVEARLGRVDVLVNNVGWTMDGLFVEKTREEWEKEIQLNLWGMINCTRAVLIALSKSLAREVGRYNVRLNVVCPGMTMPQSDEEISGLSMWAADVNRQWRTDEMTARMAKAYPRR